jgi:hypothetical protein
VTTLAPPNSTPNVAKTLVKLAAILGISAILLMISLFGSGGSTSNARPPKDNSSCVALAAIDLGQYAIDPLFNGKELLSFTLKTSDGAEVFFFLEKNIDSAYSHLAFEETEEVIKAAWFANVTNPGVGQSGIATKALAAGDLFIKQNSNVKWRIFSNYKDYPWETYRSMYKKCFDMFSSKGNWSNPASWAFKIE